MAAFGKWQILVVIGFIVIISGMILSLASYQMKNDIALSKEIESGMVYGYEMDASGGRAIDISYTLSVGYMTVSIMSADNFEELQSTGNASYENLTGHGVYLKLDNTQSNSISWTPGSSGKYYLVFYAFSDEDAELDASGTYYGKNDNILYAGIATIIAGALIIILGMLIKKAPKASIAEGESTEH